MKLVNKINGTQTVWIAILTLETEWAKNLNSITPNKNLPDCDDKRHTNEMSVIMDADRQSEAYENQLFLKIQSHSAQPLWQRRFTIAKVVEVLSDQTVVFTHSDGHAEISLQIY